MIINSVCVVGSIESLPGEIKKFCYAGCSKKLNGPELIVEMNLQRLYPTPCFCISHSSSTTDNANLEVYLLKVLFLFQVFAFEKLILLHTLTSYLLSLHNTGYIVSSYNDLLTLT